MERNNAYLGILNKSIPVTNYTIYDLEKQTWRGEIVDRTEQQKTLNGKIIFFSRFYDKENEYDKMLTEVEFLDEKLLGVPFLLVPKEKALFIYHEHSEIYVPLPRETTRRRTQ